MTNLERHPLSANMDNMSEGEFDALVSDVQVNGFVDSTICLYDGQVLDGWHRYRVAKQLDRVDELLFETLVGMSPTDFAISRNIHRRHKTPSQRAQMVVDANAWVENGANRHTLAVSNDTAKTKSEMAEQANVSTSAIARAKQVSLAGRSEEVSKGEKTASAVLTEEESKPKKIDSFFGTGDCEWYTPVDIVEGVKVVLGGVDLDPASSEAANVHIQASRFFTKAEDGLSQDWSGKVFMNPPFSDSDAFVNKFIESYRQGDIESGIVLTSSQTQPTWLAIWCKVPLRCMSILGTVRVVAMVA